jgi:quinol monooxygenase YgiN
MKRRDLLLASAALLTAPSLRAQSSGPVYVATYLEVRPASTRAGKALIAQYALNARTEAGNTRVEALQELGRSNRFVVIEAWQDPAAFAAHDKATPTLAFRDQLKTLHHSPYDQRLNTGFAIDPAPQKTTSRTVYVVTHVDVPGAFREKAEGLLKQLVEPSWTDPGQVRYDLYQQFEPRTNHFTAFSAWDSLRAFDTHGSTPHCLQFREAIAPLLGALYDERIYQSLGSVNN